MKRPKFTYANVVSTICLFILLGGGAYAGGKLSKNSAGTKQTRNGGVGLKDISKAAQKALKGQKGDTGAQGPAGPTFGAVQSGNGPFVSDPPANPDETTNAAANNGRAF